MSAGSKIEWTEATKTCSDCGEQKPVTDFCRDRSRRDGRAYRCNACRNARARELYAPKPRPDAGRRFVPPRHGDGKQARRRVTYLVEAGLIPPPNRLPCADCGHAWKAGERRHEYDHYNGYAPEHHEDVEPVCTTCHHAREGARRAA